MKKLILFVAFVIIVLMQVKASDLFVNEFGTGGAYITVGTAVAAANDGDRIVITPKAGGVAFIENFTITKSLTFISETENTQYCIQGNITITPSAPKEIIIIGLKLTGNITASANSIGSTRTVVKILFTTITSGYINFDKNNYNLTVANSTLSNGNLKFREGKILGNIITCTNSSAVIIAQESGTAPHINDTILIFGNRISTNYNTGSGITNSSNVYYFHIYNNYIKYTYTGVFIDAWKNSSSCLNEIVNNTLYKTGASTNENDGIYLYQQSASSILKIYNNVFKGFLESSENDYGIRGIYINGIVNVGYNYFYTGSFDTGKYIFGVTDDGTNVLNSNYTLNTTDGSSTGATVNGGHPNDIFTDIDLSRNDAGCYGGSYSASNFFSTPDNYNRVIYLNIPRQVNVGTNINLKAEGFDK